MNYVFRPAVQGAESLEILPPVKALIDAMPFINCVVAEWPRCWLVGPQVHGCILYSVCQFGFGVSLVCVWSEKRRQGVGRQLMQWLKDRLPPGQCIRSLLHTEFQDPSDLFLRACQFKTIRRVMLDGQEAWEYQWPPPALIGSAESLKQSISNP